MPLQMQRQSPGLKPWEWAVTSSGNGRFAVGFHVPVVPVMQDPTRGTLEEELPEHNNLLRCIHVFQGLMPSYLFSKSPPKTVECGKY